MSLEEIKKELGRQIHSIPEDRMDEASWGYEEGVLLSANQGKFIIDNCFSKEEVLEAIRKVFPYDHAPELKKELGL